MEKVSKILLIAFIWLSTIDTQAQEVYDPCFMSIDSLGFFSRSDYMVNACGSCSWNHLAADLIQWNGNEWLGRLPESGIKRPPPAGCNRRAVWLGYKEWTRGGEAIGLKLDKGLTVGETYTFTFTYASDGFMHVSSNAVSREFSPILYTSLLRQSLTKQTHRVGRLPPTIDWTSGSITFKATPEQKGHKWILLHAYETPGIILGDCSVRDALKDNFAGTDTTLCEGESVLLKAKIRPSYEYQWNTGVDEYALQVRQPGVYSVTVRNDQCESSDSLFVNYRNCVTRLVMPNFFSPNGDEWNEVFAPIEHNYIDSGTLLIFNRWGQKIFTGDLLRGWDGRQSPSAVYFYEVYYQDENGADFVKRGTVTLMH